MDNIFFITVSKTPNLEVILQKLLQLKDSRIPELQNQDDALNQLEQYFRQIGTDPILLILDDVWSGFESKVDKLRFSLPDYKILVTSRFEFPRFDFTYSLKPLNADDAMTVFCDFAFLENERTHIPDDIVHEVLTSI